MPHSMQGSKLAKEIQLFVGQLRLTYCSPHDSTNSYVREYTQFDVKQYTTCSSCVSE